MHSVVSSGSRQSVLLRPARVYLQVFWRGAVFVRLAFRPPPQLDIGYK